MSRARGAVQLLAVGAASGGLALGLAELLPAGAITLAIGGRRLELLEPRGLYALALLPLTLWAPSWSFADLSRGRRVGSLLLRCLSIAALALALAQPVEVTPTTRTSTVFAVDVSNSVDEQALAAARAYLSRALTLKGDHHVALVTFAADARRVPLPAGGAPAPLARHADGSASDLERALTLGLGLLEPSAIPQLALFSDGRETHGSLLRGAELAARRGAALLVHYDGQARPEVGIGALTLPEVIRAGEPFEVRATVVASAPQPVRARLLQDGAPSPLEPERELALEAGEHTLSFRALVRSAGNVRYRLELTPLGSDQFAENNQFERTAFVRGAPRVLYVEREGEQAYALAELLRADGFEVDVRAPGAAPQRPEELAHVDFYVLSDVPAEALSRASLHAIERFVAEGGGFMMAGGLRSFALGGYQGSALEPLLPVALETSQRRDEPSLALQLVIDKSGSMAGDKLERAKEAAVATAELLGPDSYLGVIGFDAEPLQVVRLSVAHARASVARDVGTLAAGGGTALFPALDTAYGDLAGVRARVKHVVVLTDGQTQEESLSELVRSMRADGITLSTIGLGDDVHRGLLTELARLGGGRAYFTRDPSKVPRLFTEEAELVARAQTVEEYVRARVAGTAAFLRGVPIETAPFLRGYVATRARPPPAQLVLASERGEPLLARMRVGLGWSLAFTADLKPRWSADWFRWRPFSQLLAQLVREHMRHDDQQLLPIQTAVEGDLLHATIDVLDGQERFVNGLTGELTLAHDAGGPPQTALLAPVAPGRYQAWLALPVLGTYSLRAQLGRPGEPPRLARGQVAHPFPAEYRPPFGPETTRLEQAARRAGGGALPPPERLFAARGRRVERRRERFQPLLWFVLASFLLDVATRRVPSWRRGAPRAARGT